MYFLSLLYTIDCNRGLEFKIQMQQVSVLFFGLVKECEYLLTQPGSVLMVFLRLINCALFGKSHFSTIKCVTLDYYCLVEQWRQAIVIFMLPK